MEMMMVNKAQCLGSHRRRLCSVVDDEVQALRCVKRRRRTPGSVAVGFDGNQGLVQVQPQQQNEQGPITATTVKRSSRHRWTGRYEAHLWDKLSWNVTQKKKGKQEDQYDSARPSISWGVQNTTFNLNGNVVDPDTEEVQVDVASIDGNNSEFSGPYIDNVLEEENAREVMMILIQTKASH
ncbi:hypothetical protein GOBAR_DD11756 [Gossypium barbadense]|nr:hypothetical protein GOBAR_DD11756 [Gossypium barbadense]